MREEEAIKNDRACTEKIYSRKITGKFGNSTVNILAEMRSQKIDFTELYSKISRIR